MTIVTDNCYCSGDENLYHSRFSQSPTCGTRGASKERKALLTVNGRPLAVLLPVNAETYDQTLDVVSRAQALQALNQIREHAAVTGRDKMTMEEIDAEISAARREARRARRKASRD